MRNGETRHPNRARGWGSVASVAYRRSMSDSTYTAKLVGDEATENIEMELIGGLPVKSFVHPVNGEDVVWELVPESEDYEYRKGGVPSADYS